MKIITIILAMALCGLPIVQVRAQTPKITATAGHVVISEVVTDPQSDWSSSDFDGQAGTGSVTSSDEYVEIHNAGTETVDLTGWYLKMIDSTEDTDFLDADLVKQDYDFTAFAPGDYLILGNPAGTINNDGRVELYDESDNLIDAVSFGDYDDGDPSDNTPTANSASTDDEALSRNKIATDTDTDSDDFRLLAASPGLASPNSAPEITMEDDLEATVGEKIYFDPTIIDFDGDNLSYAWDFDDRDGLQKDALSKTAGTTYQEAGGYTVTLMVTDEEDLTATATQGVSVTKAPQATNTKVRLNEVFPNPDGVDTDHEWLEIYNNSDEPANLSDYLLDDQGDIESAVALPDVIIPARGFAVLKSSDVDFSLKNTEDTVTLINLAGDKISTASYADAPSGQAYAWFNGEYYWTNQPTPGETNRIATTDDEPEDKDEEDDTTPDETAKDTPTPEETVDIQTAKTRAGETVVIEGIANVASNTLSDSYFYIQDESGGLKVYAKNLDDKYAIGDRLKITGIIGTSYAEYQIKPDNVEKVSANQSLTPLKLATGTVTDEALGRLAQVQGRITKQSGDTFYVNDDSGDLKIYLLEDTGIDKPKMKKDDTVRLTGVISKTTSGYRLLPRLASDIQTGDLTAKEGVLDQTGDDSVLGDLFTGLYLSWQTL